MEQIIAMIFTVVGGLGVFLLGMRYMSEGLQAVAGSSLRIIIGKVTNNRFAAVLAGLSVTMMVQSSSITSVMTVGFVNSSIMTLKQAVGVIMGANIGTTVTAWILAIKIGKFGLPILGVAAFFYLFSKKDKFKFIALSVMGIGMVFFGLELMKEGFNPIRTMPEFKEWFLAFDASTYFGVLKCAAVGCLLTVLVQSSSATIAITIALTSQGVISFETAAALVMGENVGTTITALLSSLGTSVNARRTAYFHALFNLIGVFWITAIFTFYIPFVTWILLTFFGADVYASVMVNGSETYKYADFGIAAVHTIFNIANVLLFFPFAGKIADLLERFVKDKSPKETKFLTSLDFKIYESGFAALAQSKAELDRMFVKDQKMMANLEEAITFGDKKVIKGVFDDEDIMDTLQHEITAFLTELLGAQIGMHEAYDARIQLRVTDELESVSDYVTQILKFDLRLKENNVPFTKCQHDKIIDLHKEIENYLNLVIEFSKNTFNLTIREKLDVQSDNITEKVRELRSEHWENLSETKYSPLVSTCYTDTIYSYRKIKNHLLNIVEALAGEK